MVIQSSLPKRYHNAGGCARPLFLAFANSHALKGEIDTGIPAEQVKPRISLLAYYHTPAHVPVRRATW